MTAIKVLNEMNPMPLTIEPGFALRAAAELMKQNRIRHLPVVENGRLVGLLSDRALKQAIVLPNRESMQVSDVMRSDPFVALDGALVSEMVRKMTEQKEDCAVVVDDRGGVVGIFTTTDGMRMLRRVLSDDEAQNEKLEDLEDALWRA